MISTTWWQLTYICYLYGVLVGLNLISQMNGVRYIWECRLIIRELVYDDEILIWKCTLLIIWYQIWFSSAWSASGNAFRATDNVDIYLLWPHVEKMVSPLLGRRKSSPETKEPCWNIMNGWTKSQVSGQWSHKFENVNTNERNIYNQISNSDVIYVFN